MSLSADTKRDWQLYRRLFEYAWPHKGVFLLSVLGAVLLSATAAGFAALMKPLMDEGFVARRPDIIQIIPLVLVVLFVFRGIGNFLSQYAISWVGRRIIADIRNAIFAHLTRLPCAFYDLHPSGMLISALFDVGQVANAVTNAIFVVIRDGHGAALLADDPSRLEPTLIFLVLAPVSAVLIRTMSRR